MRFIGLTILSFGVMEVFSYAVHRWLFHGVLWRIHQTHHQSNKFFLELNDVFSIVFALVSIGLMLFAEKPLLDSLAFPVGLGIAIYGFVYFITHDFFTHRRFFAFKSTNKILLTIRRAHQRHHQTTERTGIEPFGLFVFDYAKFGVKTNREKIRSETNGDVEKISF